MSDIGKFDKAMGSVATGLSVANGATGLLDSIFGWSAKRQQRMQKQLMQQQQEFWKEQQSILAQQQLDQWNRENEYNDPTNYFKRLMAGADANGLSKAAVLGNTPGGTVGQSATGVTAPGSTSAPNAGTSTLLGIGSANTLSNLRQRSEIANIDAQTRLMEQQTGESESRVDLNRVDKELKRANIELVNNQALTEESRRVLTQYNADLTKLSVDNFDKLREAEVAEIWSKIKYNKANTDIAEKEAKFVEQKAQSQIDYTLSQISLNTALYAVNQALAKKYGVETAGVMLDNGLKTQTFSNKVKQLEKELQYFDFNQLKSLFSNTSSLIFALANDKPFAGNGALSMLDKIIKDLYNSLSK